MKITRAYDLAYPEGVLRGGDVYVEIGCHKGRFLEESGLFNPTNTYHLVEPQPSFIKALGKRYRHNSNVNLHPVAIATQDGEAELWIVPGGCGSSLHYKERAEGSVAVRTITLAMLMSWTGGARFLAVNAEGAEYSILHDRAALERVDYMAVEFHPGYSGFDTRKFVEANLAAQFETLAFLRDGDPYNIWVGRAHNATD